MSQVKSDERVVFFPTAARLNEQQDAWLVPIHGWIFEPEDVDLLRSTLVRELKHRLELDPNEPATRIFDERIRLFLVDNERGKCIGIQIAGEKHVLPPSTVDGHFHATIQIPAAQAQPFIIDGVLRYEAITRPGDMRTFSGICHCLPDRGISVISDVDDTIKVTDVRDKTELLRNTFVREFQAVEGMSAAYARWSAEGVEFHFISASPWQLYEPLAEFMRESGFAHATIQLKRFRMKDSNLFNLFEDPIAYKLSAMEPVLQAYPKRRFVLVGDSGEKDPEAFGSIARRYPLQIKQIFIRDVTGEPTDAARYEDAFRDVPKDSWQVFHDPATLPAIGDDLPSPY